MQRFDEQYGIWKSYSYDKSPDLPVKMYNQLDTFSSRKEKTMADFWKDAEVIHTYTRKQALEDGMLVDLNQWIPVKESGYKCPVVCTAEVFAIIEAAVNNEKFHNDYKGVIWDILLMSRVNKTEKWETGCKFQVKIIGAGRIQFYTFKIECGPGDDAEPVLTVMQPQKS
jgi:hypothetical protein